MWVCVCVCVVIIHALFVYMVMKIIAQGLSTVGVWFSRINNCQLLPSWNWRAARNCVALLVYHLYYLAALNEWKQCKNYIFPFSTFSCWVPDEMAFTWLDQAISQETRKKKKNHCGSRFQRSVAWLPSVYMKWLITGRRLSFSQPEGDSHKLQRSLVSI